MGVGVQQYLVSSGMSACVLPDHLKKPGSLHKSFVIGGIQMHLAHMQRLIATIDIPGCPVIEPHLSLQPVQIRQAAVLSSVISGASEILRTLKKRRLQGKISVLRGESESLKHICRDFHILHPFHNPLKNARLQNNFRIHPVYHIRQSRRISENALRHLPSYTRFRRHVPEISHPDPGLPSGRPPAFCCHRALPPSQPGTGSFPALPWKYFRANV